MSAVLQAARHGLSQGTNISESVHSVSHLVANATENALSWSIPPGFVAATAELTSKAPKSRPTVDEDEVHRDPPSRRLAEGRMPADTSSYGFARTKVGPTFANHKPVPGSCGEDIAGASRCSSTEASPERQQQMQPLRRGQNIHCSGCISRPKRPKTQSTIRTLNAFWQWFLTPFGFLITIYGLNVVAWGGMLFLLLCNASPAMCWAPNGHGGKYFNCNDINSPRRQWIEWDSQILNALFCVTGLGLAPWRFRDLYYLARYRCTSNARSGLEAKMFGMRKLAGHYRSWFRLPGSQTLDHMTAKEYVLSIGASVATWDDVRLPLPETKKPDEPLTGVRAPPTCLWKVDAFIWCQVFNTFFQCCLCGFMWGMNRYNRPSWATGLFVALACGIAGLGGIVSLVESKKVKRIEGIAPPADTQDEVEDDKDAELGLQRTQTEHESIHVPQQVKGEGRG